MKLGPILQKSVKDGLSQLETLAAGRSLTEVIGESDWDSLDRLVYQEIIPDVVPADDGDAERVIADTPELLAYPIDLYSLYPMEVVTPGWFIGEAAYRAVRDAIVEQATKRLA